MSPTESTPQEKVTAHTASREYVSGEKYILPVDKQEQNRLELQHTVLKRAFNNRILIAPHEKTSDYFVLDSGVGTAAWLIDLASELSPSAILHGLDIDLNRIPSAHPTNISFSKGSVLELPHGWSYRFDFIHQRLLTCALTYKDWQQALSQMLKVLRPGGWIQIGEYGRADADEAAANEARVATRAWAKVHQALYEHEDLLYRAYDDLPKLMKEAGFVDIHVERRRVPLGAWAGEIGSDGAGNLIVFYRALKARILRIGGLGLVKSEKEIDDMIDAVHKEWDETYGAGTDFYIICAQKPVSDSQP